MLVFARLVRREEARTARVGFDDANAKERKFVIKNMSLKVPLRRHLDWT